jgi:hypothetical protein
MLQLVKNEKQIKVLTRPNYMLVELCDESLSPVAEAGDLALIAQYAPPKNGDMVGYQHEGETFVRWWRQVNSTVRLSDAHGNEQIINLADILVLGVVREIRRRIINGLPSQKRLLELSSSSGSLVGSLLATALFF